MQVEGPRELGCGRELTIRCSGQAMPQVEVVGGGESGSRLTSSRSMDAGRVPQVGRAPRLVERRPRVDAAAKGADDQLGVVTEAERGIANQPAPNGFERLR